MADETPVTQAELALALEVIRRYVARMGAMTVAVNRDDFAEHQKRFLEEDEAFTKFVAAVRGEG